LSEGSAVKIAAVRPAALSALNARLPSSEVRKVDARTDIFSFGSILGGTVTGLSGNGLVLRNNAGNDLAVAGGSFTFSAALTSGAVQRHGCDSTRR
jgi:hypothetical protein